MLAQMTIVAGFMGVIVLAMYVPKLGNLFTTTQQTLFVYAFTDAISPEAIDEFYKKTGVNIRLSYFQSNDELLAKLRLSKGEGYDVLVASDYMIKLLHDEGLLARLDHSQLPVIEQLDPRLLGKYYDPGNENSLPLHWTPYVIGYSKKFFGDLSKVGWQKVFSEPKDYTISMPDDRREMIFLASMYLFNQTQGLRDEQLAQVRELLIKQKKWVESYSSDKQEYELAAGVVPMIVTQGSYMKKMLDYTIDYAVTIPVQGSLLVIDNLAIAQATTQQDLAHQFVNFVLGKDISIYSNSRYGYTPANAQSYELLPKDYRENRAFFPDDATFRTLRLLSSDIDPKVLEQVWLAVKTA